MCGINGFSWQDEKLAGRMNVATAHRGPDSTGVWSDANVTLGHNRLAIIDLSSAAAQPMLAAGGRLAISFNGEIYNFLDIKKEISGYDFRSSSDTEVILAAYERWGVAAFDRLNGIFAFGLWDAEKQELMLVRDRAGVKPLYYFWDGKRLIFSSEIKGVLEHTIPRTLSQEALAHYLRVLYVPAPHTMFDGIKKLEPGTVLTLRNGTISIESFVRPQSMDGPVDDEGLRQTIDSAVTRQLVSDRPLGIYLSGGFDSSIVLDAISRVRTGVNTFSVGFTLDEKEVPEKYNTDQRIARATAARYGARHHEVMLSSDEAADLFEKAVWHLDEPNGNPTTIATMHLSAFTKPFATVVCGGDGGDELFGGYERYRLSLYSTYYRMFPTAVRRALNQLYPRFAKLDTPPGVERYARFLFQKDAVVKRVVAAPVSLDATRSFFENTFFRTSSADFETTFMDVDRRSWLVDESLMRTDKMAMSAGVEARVPLLDNEVVAYAQRVPRSQKVTPFSTKKILKRAFRGRLPEYLYHEPKRGWFSPAGVWLRHQKFGDMASEILSPSYYEGTKSLFNWDEVRAIFEGHRSAREYHLTMLWALLVFQVWARMYRIEI